MWTGGFLYWIMYLTNWKINPELWGQCKPTYFVYYFSQHYSAWILTIMTIERCISVLWPLQSKKLCTVRNAKLISIVIGLVFLIFDGQWLITITVKGGYCDYIDGISVVYQKIYNKIDASLYCYVPFILMMMANLIIISKMMLARKNANKVADIGVSADPKGKALSKNARKTTIMLLSVTLVFCFLTMPVSTYYAATPNVPPLAHALLVNLGYLNHGINFWLYCLTGSKFRAEVLKIIPCKCKKSSVHISTITSTTQSNL